MAKSTPNKKKTATKQVKTSASKMKQKSASNKTKQKSASKPKQKPSSKQETKSASKQQPTSKQEKSNNKQETKSSSKAVWKYSKAKKILVECLTNGDIPLDADEMPAEEVYQQHPEFAEFTLKHFTERLRYNRKSIASKKGRANDEMKALAHDQAIHPTRQHNWLGCP